MNNDCFLCRGPRSYNVNVTELKIKIAGNKEWLKKHRILGNKVVKTLEKNNHGSEEEDQERQE